MKSLSRVRLLATPWTVAHQAPYPWDSPGKNTGAGSLSLLQGNFPTQDSNQGLLHCRQILYRLSYQGSPCATMHAYVQSCPALCNPMDYNPPDPSVHGDSPGKNTRVGCHFLFQCLYQFSHSVVSNFSQPPGPQHARPPCPSPTPGVHPNTCPLSWWCHPTISSSVVPCSSCLQSFPASGSFQMSQFFASGVQSIGISASASVLSVNIQDWLPLGLNGLISLLFKGFWRVFSSTPVQKYQFFSSQLFFIV